MDSGLTGLTLNFITAHSRRMKLLMPLFFAAALILQFTTNAVESDNEKKKKAEVTLDANSTATKKTEAYKEALQQSEWIHKLENNLGQKIIGISLWQFIAAFLVILAGLIIKRILISIIEKKITKLFFPFLQQVIA